MRVIDPLNTETNFTVNASGLVTAVEHPLSNTTTFAYDNLGRLLTETDPLSNVRTYEYDLAGRLISRTDPKNQVIEHTYNDRNELTRIDYPDLSFVSFAYNDASARTQSPNHTERLDEYCYGMRATSAKTGAGRVDDASEHSHGWRGRKTTLPQAVPHELTRRNTDARRCSPNHPLRPGLVRPHEEACEATSAF